MDIEHNVISLIMALGYFWQKVDIVLYNSEVAICQLKKTLIL